ncbi:2Fe-2S iron-sulfur cluster-binding protein [[Limnothrix rosea] IAM M-220]|uniref:2Fe-2S iron-sulfur cluster-binding protein n=1 Tax=[Limnothrix rosea] IAM M-220 TaxID=454133 RepID=UPI00095CA466|nr:2Fe-2S iron-sulfur cluster-binding protein [[Limnothrix rosea] IAM M-220]OKH19111.1 (2Fe-2S)-binding protein [[Limnothrix rosea] IAM M-220]
MPTVTFNNQTITCEAGDNLRKVLLKHNASLYNGKANIINCMGIGSCGTCAVEIKGHLPERNWKETARLSLPPHQLEKGRRLACQIKVESDLVVTKYDGFWGQGDRQVIE